jgi:hypothetical protein
MWNEKTLSALVKEQPEIAAWLKEHKDSLYEALHVWPFEDATMIAVLANIRRYIGGNHPLFKDEWGQARCETFARIARGEPVDLGELRMAIALLLQAYGGACDALERLRRPSRPPPLYRPNPNWRRG